MRAAPALQVTVDRRGPWRIAVTALMVLGIAPMLVWFARLNLAPLPGLLVTLSVLCATVALTWRWTRLQPVVLRYDGAGWHLNHDGAEQSYRPGRISVLMDIGTAMLLRFDAEPTAMSSFRRWLPVRAIDVGTQWHALRCAVYSPPPSASPRSTAAATDL